MARLPQGIPAIFRQRIWLALADHQIASQHVDWTYVCRVAFNERMNPDDDSLGAQIVKDLHRTGCDQFGAGSTASAEDRAALKRVLLAYARWNKRVGYCQGFNILVAVILDVMQRDEEAALKVTPLSALLVPPISCDYFNVVFHFILFFVSQIMIYLIDFVLPESYFAQNLQALSVDMAVFRELLRERNPSLANHLDFLQAKAGMCPSFASILSDEILMFG
ncbi:unnamed protein product [Protopolystoma xenopodis]|uniref:Rab-GAP TBC domain-containing protein n=1 Tax=Protopolystoma xenopodis TaxID=117903 RepID=A0A3S5CG92_9PLAT|nr:unnamed protein product [Protopolystoma xenopodis]